jgi:uncharacterized protein (TIGR02246 family)
MDMTELQRWIDAYVKAWETYDPAAISALFAEDALYYPDPLREPWQGREEIVRQWTEEPDAPGSWRTHYRAVATTGTTGVVRGHTTYLKDDGSIDKEYANVYLIEFDDQGRATEFVEFFMRGDRPASGSPAAGSS